MRHWFSKPYADFVARLRVPAGFLLVAAFAWFAAPAARSLAIGFPLAVLGLALRAWAAGHLAKDSRLATGGPYAHLRNPLYVGTLTVAAGLAVAAARWPLAALFGAVFAFIYLPAIELEEQHLRDLFAKEYDGYAARVPRLLPRLTAAPAPPARFSPRLYWKNREYEALAAFLAGAAYLVWRALG
jgi:protein-S-isoprenylcysteine O-methyltransferase Ste14